ncbi:MAG: TnsA endonuclease N-terminal domain-containing protein [Clostridiales bacterium]|nr:TnsA endonuclease N-terminal domain-containing protein [Clostridiales bacterium]
MSNNELAYFYILDWSDAVTDIREQYPLSDLECAVSVAAQAGIKYPIDHISGYPYVLTCDFMITTRGETKARTIKTTIDLNNRRTIDKLEIERRYWITKGVDWKIITEQNISFQKAKNIEWLYMAQDFCIPSEFEHARHMMMQLLLYGRYSVLDAVKTVENEYALATGSGIQLFKQLVLDKAITINLDESLNLNEKGVAV